MSAVSRCAAGSARAARVRRWGTGTVAAVALSALAARGSGGEPDPTRLPLAVASIDAESTYGALHRETPEAGASYRDPCTGAFVLRLTDPTFPVENAAAAGADYSNGGPYVSQVWRAGEREFVTVVVYLYLASAEPHWAIDVDLEARTVQNARALPRFDADTAQAWSLDPDTPRIWYCVRGGELRRFDTAAMEFAEDGERFGHFPVDPPDERLTRGAWLQSTRDDARFCWLQYGSADGVMGGSIYTVHDVARGEQVLGGALGGSSAFNECYLTADGAFLLGNLGSTRLIRVDDGADLGLAYGGRPLVHGAVIDRCYVAFDSDRTARMLALLFDDDGWSEPVVIDAERELYRPTEFEAGANLPAANHESSGWKLGNGDGGLDAWYLTSGDQDGPIAGAGEAAWFLTLYRPSTQERRHLAFTDNRVGASTGSEAYSECTFGHLQPNGRGAVFTSVMGDVAGNRSDAFFAFVPLAEGGAEGAK